MIITKWFNELGDDIGNFAALQRAARALNIPSHRLRYVIAREGQSSNRPLKPTSPGREELQARKVAARLREQERQRAMGLHNFKEGAQS